MVIAVDEKAHAAALAFNSPNLVSYYLNATELHGVTKGIDNYPIAHLHHSECLLL
jgi:hypothetical protein